MTLFILLFLQIVFAQSQLTFDIASKPTVFYQYDEARLMSNRICKSAEKGKLCSEFDFLKKLKLPKNDKQVMTGSLGSHLCRESLNGIIIMGINPVSKSQNSFCKINDLFVDIGTLSYYGSL